MMASIGDISGPLKLLFETVRKPNGKQYSPREVAKFVRAYTGGTTTHVTIRNILAGADPRNSIVIALAEFFGVDVSFFTKAADEAAAEAQAAAERRDDQAPVILMRMNSLAPDEKQHVIDTINMLARAPRRARPESDR